MAKSKINYTLIIGVAALAYFLYRKKSIGGIGALYRHVPKRKGGGANVMTGAWCYDFESPSDKVAMDYAKNKFYSGSRIYKENGLKWKLVGTVNI